MIPRSEGKAEDPRATVDVSIILVNWNGLAFTANALTSLQEQTRDVTYDVFVVDNGTTRDASAKEIPRRFPWVHFIGNPDNRGFSCANNQAIRRARGRYLLLLNNDTLQIEDAVSKAVRYMDARLDIGALGITHLNNDAQRTVQASYFKFSDPWKEVRGLLGEGQVSRDPSASVPPEGIDVDWVVGSFLLIRRACYEDVGELDERFFVYDEDMDWCLRARRAGWNVRYWPGAKLIHLGSASKPFQKDKTFMHFRSHLSYFRKNHSSAAAGAYYAAMALRLSLATGKQLAGALIGDVGFADVRERLLRQRDFVLLRSSKHGVNGAG